MGEPLSVQSGVQSMFRRARRRRRQKLRVALRKDQVVRLGGREGSSAADVSVATARSVGWVMSFIRDDVSAAAAEAANRSVVPEGPEFYAPTTTLTLHPEALTVPEPQVEKYLYLTKAF